MKNNKTKVVAAALGVAVLVMGAGGAVYAFAQNSGSENGKLDPAETVVTAEEKTDNKEDKTATEGAA